MKSVLMRNLSKIHFCNSLNYKKLMNSLKELSSYCKLMLLEVTEDQIQFHRLKLHSEVFSKKERSVILDEEIVVDNSISEKDLSEKIKEGQFELLIANATNTTKNLIIENFIETNPILQAVYSNESLTEQDRAINFSLGNCDNIISKLLKFHNFLLKNEKKILHLQKETLKLFSENRKKDREEKMLSVLEKQQKDKLVREMNDIKHRVIIGIILESGIDWYGNEHWRNMMLKTVLKTYKYLYRIIII
ncbi:unnamed protein product [Pneumocystis jirovecii]|uniref:Centromere protein H C-terminal domain-containing protein n=1 Tax=Pneumocystis jirovecii TaxID=42068 RepID=L0PG58_PNEJI|nr:unnamed protein product [Pneumocystis jirovecii]